MTEIYDAEGVLTGSTLTSYSYTPSGEVESEVTQTKVDGEWENSSIRRFIHDDTGRIIEQQDGMWRQQDGEWDMTRRILFDTSDDGATLSVSFQKKSGDAWVWDMFNNQTILFESYMKNQQRALRYYMYEEMNEPAKINQFEITLGVTDKPTYMSVGNIEDATFSVFPNPARDNLTVTAPIQNAVIRIYDLQGRMLLAMPFDFQTNINVGDWAKGVYLWEVWNGPHKETSGKWIKE